MNTIVPVDPDIELIKAEISNLNREIDALKKSETGRIRIEVTKMFNRVMTERDLFAFRIPWYKFTTRKIKNTNI